jgi:hypothetical protein
MSVEQGKNFAEELKDLSEEFKADCEEMTTSYENGLKGLAVEFQEGSHRFAQGMTARANQYTVDIQELYEEIYGEGIEGPEGEVPPEPEA